MTQLSVFGGTGFVGSAFVRAFSDRCLVVPREERSPPTNEVLYLISTISNYNVFDDPTLDIRTNLLTLMDTLQECRRPGMVFNFVSSWFVYGTCDLPAPETTLPDPRGFYSITKYAAERLLISYCETFDIAYRILRLGNIYGPGDTKAGTQKNAIQHMVYQLSENQPIQLYEDGDVIRDMMHVEDAARAIDLVIREGQLNTVYNVSNGEPTRLRDLIDLAVRLTGSNSKITSIPTPAFHQRVQARDFWLDTTRLRGLGYQPQITLEKGLKSLLTAG